MTFKQKATHALFAEYLMSFHGINIKRLVFDPVPVNV